MIEPIQRLPAHRRKTELSVLSTATASRVSELAAQLGVSVMTVRRDLAELQRQGLVKRIHGGAVLPSASTTIPSQHTIDGRVAMLVPNLDFDWPSVARSADAAARWRGLRLLLRSDATNDLSVLARLFAQDDVIGVGAAIDTSDSGVIEFLDAQTKPFVLIESNQTSHRQLTFDSVVTDHTKGAHEVVRHLWELGHRRIGCVLRRTSPASKMIADGWRAICDELAISPDQTWLQTVPDHCNAAFTPAAQAVVAHCLQNETTGLLVHSDREATSLAQLLELQGLRVPEDISIVSYDDDIAALYSPALTAVRPAGGSLGAAAIDLLVARHTNPHRPIHHVTISPELVVRESTMACH